MADQSLVFAGTLLVITGFVLAFLAVMVPALRGAKSEGGAVIIIGPFPIVFGSNSRVTRTMLILTILVSIVILAFFLAQWFLVSAS